jgi:hypothetical protein
MVTIMDGQQLLTSNQWMFGVAEYGPSPRFFSLDSAIEAAERYAYARQGRVRYFIGVTLGLRRRSTQWQLQAVERLLADREPEVAASAEPGTYPFSEPELRGR